MLLNSNLRIISKNIKSQSIRTIFATNICYSSSTGTGSKPGDGSGKKSKKGGFWGKLASKSSGSKLPSNAHQSRQRSSPNRNDEKNKSQSNASMQKSAEYYRVNRSNDDNSGSKNYRVNRPNNNSDSGLPPGGIGSRRVYRRRPSGQGAQVRSGKSAQGGRGRGGYSGNTVNNQDDQEYGTDGRRGRAKARRSPYGEEKEVDHEAELNKRSGRDALVTDPIDAATLDMLDLSKFADSFKSGNALDSSKMDQFEKDAAHIMIEALKSPDDSIMDVLDTRRKNKHDHSWDNLPEARSSYQLMKELQPKIDPSIEEGSIAHQMGCDAWTTLTNNYYFTDKQKANMSNEVARIAQHAINVPEEKEYDMTYYPSFRPGAEYFEQQKLLQKDQVENTYQQEDTNWDQDAVFDEDQL